jgi:hypothetical protein
MIMRDPKDGIDWKLMRERYAATPAAKSAQAEFENDQCEFSMACDELRGSMAQLALLLGSKDAMKKLVLEALADAMEQG